MKHENNGAQNFKRSYNNTANVTGDKVGQTRRRLNRIATVVLKSFSLTVFQRSFLLFVIPDIMLGTHIRLTPSCDFVIHKKFLKFHSEYVRPALVLLTKCEKDSGDTSFNRYM